MTGVCMTSLVGAMCVWSVYCGMPHDRMNALQRRRALASTIRTLGSVLWPAILVHAVPPDARDSPALAFPLLWNAGVWMLDSHLLHRAPSNSTTVPASLRLDPSNITALTFGICGLIGARPDGRFTHLFMYAIVGCIVLVLPSHNLQPGCIEEQVFESVQKAALMWMIGFLMAGIALTRAQKSCSPALSLSSRE